MPFPTQQEARKDTRETSRAPEEPSVETLYALLFAPLVRRATWRHRLSKSDATDIVQEAFLLALQKDFPESHPGAWLARVVDYLALNWKRKASRRERLLRQHAAGAWGAAAPEDQNSREEDS